jgi:hypothetical protein
MSGRCCRPLSPPTSKSSSGEVDRGLAQRDSEVADVADHRRGRLEPDLVVRANRRPVCNPPRPHLFVPWPVAPGMTSMRTYRRPNWAVAGSSGARYSALCRSHSAAVSEVGAVEREMVTTTNLIFIGTQRVHTSLASGRSGPTLTVTPRPVNSGFPLIANADQRPLMRPPEAGAQVRILSGAPCWRPGIYWAVASGPADGSLINSPSVRKYSARSPRTVRA